MAAMVPRSVSFLVIVFPSVYSRVVQEREERHAEQAAGTSDSEPGDSSDDESVGPEPTLATAEAALRRPFRKAPKTKPAAATSRWAKIIWDTPGGPYGDQLNLLQRCEYRLGMRNGDWRVLEPKSNIS